MPGRCSSLSMCTEMQGAGEGEVERWGPGRALEADLFSDNWEPLKFGGGEQHLLISTTFAFFSKHLLFSTALCNCQLFNPVK